VAEKNYYWLKLPSGFFKDRPLKKLRRMAGGAVYTIIYQKLLLLSLENNGKLFFEEIEDSFEEEMALELDETIEDIQMTLIYLQKNNLINQVNPYEYFMPQIPEMIGRETDAARRKRKSRENKSVTSSQVIGTLSQQVTKCHTEIDIEKDIELELEKDIVPPKGGTAEQSPAISKINYKEIIEMFNSTCTTLNKIKSIEGNRKETLRIWIKTMKGEYLSQLYSFFKSVNDSDFLSGRDDKWHNCSFDWVIKPANRRKILEGNYTNKNVIKKGKYKEVYFDENGNKIYE
jgi:predicted phage replisome organizer